VRGALPLEVACWPGARCPASEGSAHASPSLGSESLLVAGAEKPWAWTKVNPLTTTSTSITRPA
jgi:hypothetical protein